MSDNLAAVLLGEPSTAMRHPREEYGLILIFEEWEFLEVFILKFS